jgi:hypothetical protein
MKDKKSGKGQWAEKDYQYDISGSFATLEEELDGFNVAEEQRELIEKGVDFRWAYAPEGWNVKRSDYDTDDAGTEKYVQAVLDSQVNNIKDNVRHLVNRGEQAKPEAYVRKAASKPFGGGGGRVRR